MSTEKVANFASWWVAKAFREVCRRHTALDSPRLWRADLSAPCRGVVGPAQKNACRRYAPSTANCEAYFRHALCGCDAYPPPTTRTAHSLVFESRGAIDRYVPSAHSYPIRIAAFSAFSASHVPTAVLAHFSKKTLSRLQKNCLRLSRLSLQKSLHIYMRRKPPPLAGAAFAVWGGTAAYSPATAIFCALVASCTPSVDTLARHTYMPRGTRRPLRSVRSQVMAAERNMSLRPLC